MGAPQTKKTAHIGRSLPRLEDRTLLTGRGRFAADISFPGQLHMRMVRSNFAHGRLRAVDATPALAKKGVHAVWTAADVVDIPPIDFRLSRLAGLEPYRQRLFATGQVRYVGDPVAAVFAEDPYLAEDAADLVTLDVEELPAILRADDDPGEYEPNLSTEPAILRKGYGDVDAAFAGAHMQALLVRPEGVENWSGPYLKGETIPEDPWGHPFLYRMPSERQGHDYDLYSLGPSGKPGGAGADAEIVND